LGLGAEAEKLLVLRGVLVHPSGGLVEPQAGLKVIAELPVSHGEDEEISAAAAGGELDRLLQIGQRLGDVNTPCNELNGATKNPVRKGRGKERVKGFEPSTLTLGTSRSTN
jgi:hypothetical protein